jgi:DNA-directed RNA polymerase specialized sigma24 family protein
VDLLRRRYADTARSLSKSASAVTKTAANARDKMAERLTSLREGLGKGLSFRSSSQ